MTPEKARARRIELATRVKTLRRKQRKLDNQWKELYLECPHENKAGSDYVHEQYVRCLDCGKTF